MNDTICRRDADGTNTRANISNVFVYIDDMRARQILSCLHSHCNNIVTYLVSIQQMESEIRAY